jgi:hypothetical protein
MKRISLMVAAAAVAAPAEALAQQPTNAHVRAYQHAYREVQQTLGHRAPGRNIVKDGLSSGSRVTDGRVVTSLSVLRGMLAPPAGPQSVQTSTPTSSTTRSSSQAPAQTTSSSAPSGLMGCIIQHESGGNPQAVTGQYQGIGQWSPEAWRQDGATQYAPTPTGASYAEQQQVLASEGAAGMQQQQGQYDGC